MITVKYFASLREQLGRSQDTLDAAGLITAQDVWSKVSGEAEPPTNILVAINLEYADLKKSVKDGDEIAFFPPITGG